MRVRTVYARDRCLETETCQFHYLTELKENKPNKRHKFQQSYISCLATK